MADEHTYDPDRMSILDIDLEELSEEEALGFIGSYLDNPVSKALAEDLGREFRSLPADQQAVELAEQLASSQKRRHDLMERFEDLVAQMPDLRDDLMTLKRAYDSEVEQIETRLCELRTGTEPGS